MARNPKSATKFAVCIKSDDEDLLTPRMIYQLIADEKAAESKFSRVLDNEGADYLYPAEYFMTLDLPYGIERALSDAA